MKRFMIVGGLVAVMLLSGVGAVQAQDITAEGRVQQREERIEQYKQAATDRLSEAEQTRIAAVCKAAQTRVERLQSNLDTVVENRQKTYSALADKLDLVSDELDASGIDTSQLDTYVSQMQLDAQEIVSSVVEYQQILADLAGMDCESDVDGFQAALTVARTTRNDLKTAAQDLKTYVQETIQPELQALRQQLVDTTSAEDQ